MGIIELLILLVIAGICGAIAEMIVGFSPGGFVVSIIIGVIGAYLGTVLAGRLNLPAFLPVTIGGQTIEIVWAILGSILLLLVISLFRGRRRRLL
ncbi:MAG: hypothetical protein AVDCRST_MAG26-929 [uncultured Chloroflexia bacterium]|uniref:GlsB/YeaQ/YmgE family stress response membrane protein n=1 Tax=uncultured Chloroflexia bacterium TaxID=1672391 RepID=A0A6J4HP18_9CHLR|nr:MAG: hypothetical protein AVDCRST_MAG26-929 [uncultured Chloroflexia bacterium]